MQNIKKQQGVGMVEVLVALVILAIGVLGFTALQLRAVDATSEALNRIQAMNLARDLAERIRVNRTGYETYQTVINAGGVEAPADGESAVDCLNTNCDASEMATYDATQVLDKANNMGLALAMLTCPGVTNSRQCIYVAWGSTTASDDDSDADACTNNGIYRPSSNCIVMEAY